MYDNYQQYNLSLIELKLIFKYNFININNERTIEKIFHQKKHMEFPFLNNENN